jgi:hypothetical protein
MFSLDIFMLMPWKAEKRLVENTSLALRRLSEKCHKKWLLKHLSLTLLSELFQRNIFYSTIKAYVLINSRFTLYCKQL